MFWSAADDGAGPDDPGLAWDAADRYAVTLLWRALPEVRSAWAPAGELRAAAELIRSNIRKWPYKQLARAVWGRGRPPADDTQFWLDVAGACALAGDQRKMDPQTYASLSVLRPADWAGAVIGLTRAGVGAPVTGEHMARYARECAEIAGQRDPDDGEVAYDPFASSPGDDDEAYDPFAGGARDDELLARAYEVVVSGWQAIGAVDEQERLTVLGWWGLPRALARAWNGDFDAAGWADSGADADAEGGAPRGSWPGLEPHPDDLGIRRPADPYGI